MEGYPQYQFVSKSRSTAFYERVLYAVRRLFRNSLKQGRSNIKASTFLWIHKTSLVLYG